MDNKYKDLYIQSQLNQPMESLMSELTNNIKLVMDKYNYDVERLSTLCNKLRTGERMEELYEKLERMRKEMRQGFRISDKEHQAIKSWQKEGRNLHKFEYRFLPTEIGTVGKIVDLDTGEEFNFTDYSRW